MIGFLRGEVLTVDSDSMIVVAAGVGYEVTCTPATLAMAQPGIGLELYIYTQVREDAILLYGFLKPVEKQMFMSLIKVNGVGPKSAITILGAAPIERLLNLINDGDAKGLSQLPKVGKKTAEQIVLTLKGKLVTADEVAKPAATKTRQEIISALVHLGFRLNDVERTVDQLPQHADLETGVREGLAALTS